MVTPHNGVTLSAFLPKGNRHYPEGRNTPSWLKHSVQQTSQITHPSKAPEDVAQVMGPSHAADVPRNHHLIAPAFRT